MVYVLTLQHCLQGCSGAQGCQLSCARLPKLLHKLVAAVWAAVLVEAVILAAASPRTQGRRSVLTTPATLVCAGGSWRCWSCRSCPLEQHGSCRKVCPGRLLNVPWTATAACNCRSASRQTLALPEFCAAHTLLSAQVWELCLASLAVNEHGARHLCETICFAPCSGRATALRLHLPALCSCWTQSLPWPSCALASPVPALANPMLSLASRLHCAF